MLHDESMPSDTAPDDNEALDFHFLDLPGVPYRRSNVGHEQARLEALCPLATEAELAPVESTKVTTKQALLAEVKLRGQIVIREFDKDGGAYIYLRGESGWYRWTNRKFRRQSQLLSTMLFEAAKSGKDIALCPKRPEAHR
jgi:hypothetical protein